MKFRNEQDDSFSESGEMNATYWVHLMIHISLQMIPDLLNDLAQEKKLEVMKCN